MLNKSFCHYQRLFSTDGCLLSNHHNWIITFRKSEANKSTTTPAGTFDCFKISYDSEIKAGLKMTVKGVEWVAKNIGVVRSESYDKNGKLTGYTVMSALVK